MKKHDLFYGLEMTYIGWATDSIFRMRFLLLIALIVHSSVTFAGDFRYGAWGATKEGVKHTETATLKKETNNELEYEGKVAEIEASIIYKFEGNHLIKGMYMFPGMIRLHPDFPIDPSGLSFRPPNPYEDHYKVRMYLITKYGNPTTDRQWEEIRGKSKMKNSASYWLTDRTLVSHVLSVADNGLFVAHVAGYFPVTDRNDALQKLKELSNSPTNP